MKKILSFLVILGLYLSTSAQIIELKGVGMVNQESQTLTFDNPGTITDVTVYAIFKGRLNTYEDPQGDVTFNAETGDYYGEESIINLNYQSGFDDPYIGYWTKDLASVGSVTTTTLNEDDRPYVISTMAYIYRTVPNPSYISYISSDIVFIYRTGENNPYVYEFDIAPSSNERDINVKIPISELDDGLTHGGRIAVINIEAGDVTVDDVEIVTWNEEESFFLGEYTLANVPGNITKVTVSIYSPNPNLGEDWGDSFFVNGIVVDVDIDGEGCTLTQGYWKTHGFDAKPKKFDETWNNLKDVTFFSSGMDYYDAINEKAKGNAYYILAHQYIAAKLNFFAGANPAEAWDAFSAATVLFTGTNPNDIADMKGNDPIRQQFIAAADILADYNEGLVGPGHCDDKSTYAEIETSTGSEINVYPNPMSNSGTIDFTVVNDAQTTVEMYNLMGQKVATLFDQPAQADQKYQVRIEANRYEKGLYVISLRNGSNTVTSKVNIN